MQGLTQSKAKQMTKKERGKKKTIVAELFLNWPLHPHGISDSDKRKRGWKKQKAGWAQTCNEYISWLAETYLNVISNKLKYTLYILFTGIALKMDELPAK